MSNASHAFTLAKGVCAAACLLLNLPFGSASAQGTYTVLHNFRDGSVANDGESPEAALIQAADGSIYGTTYVGGSAGYGVVFNSTSANAFTISHNFGDGSVTSDGRLPEAALLQAADGNSYGTTNEGGSAGLGTVYEMTSAGVVTILHVFGDGTVADDGARPAASLLQASDGNLYGTTSGGGVNNGGTVFEITSAGVVTILHDFGDGTVTSDGMEPNGGLIQASDGNFYGITSLGGTEGKGTIFEMTAVGAVTILHNFGDGSVANDGQVPEAALLQAGDGNFYGTTADGGAAAEGTVFQMTPAGVVTILHSFGDNTVADDGLLPKAPLIQASDGNLYGTTPAGGANSPGNTVAGGGTVFEITTSGATTIVHSFAAASVTTDGNTPVAALLQTTSGDLEGTTEHGGTDGLGIVFDLDLGLPAPTAPATTISFSAGLTFFSSPYDYPNTDLDTLFGYSNAVIALWSEPSYSYYLTPQSEASHVRLGAGYWARFPQAVTLPANLGTPEPTTSNADFSLYAGWTAIGDPFFTTISASSLLFNGGTESFAAATSGSSPLIGATLWQYDQSVNAYEPATSLVPGVGYWIFAYSATDVQFPHP